MGNNESKQEESKPDTRESRAIGGTIGGGIGVTTTGVGIGLMFLGPVGMIAGGVLLGTGLSMSANTVQQCVQDKEFSYGQMGISAGVGAVGGVVAAPFSVAGGAAATVITSTAGKVATVVGAEVVGGAVSGAVTQTIQKKAEGKEVTLTDVGKGALLGGVVGGIGGAAGQVATSVTKGARTIGDIASKTAIATKITVGAASGAVGGGGGAVLATLIQNAIEKGDMKYSNFKAVMMECGMTEAMVEKLWELLLNNGVIVDEVVQKELPKSFELPEEMAVFRELVEKLLEDSLNITKGLASAAVQGVVTGGITGAATVAGQLKQQRRIAKVQVRDRAQQVKRGAWGGSMEAEAYGSKHNKCVVIHHEDGSTTVHGRKKAADEVHLHYSTTEQHYTPANADGKRISKDLPASKQGDCFFKAIAYSTGDDPRALCETISGTMQDKPLKLKGTNLTELESGGVYQGGGEKMTSAPKPSEIKSSIRKAIKSVPDSELDPKVKHKLCQDADIAVKDLLKLGRNKHAMNRMEALGERRGGLNIHCLRGDRKGQIAVDINVSDPNATNRGPYRLIFKKFKNTKNDFFGFTFHEFLPEHNY